MRKTRAAKPTTRVAKAAPTATAAAASPAVAATAVASAEPSLRAALPCSRERTVGANGHGDGADGDPAGCDLGLFERVVQPMLGGRPPLTLAPGCGRGAAAFNTAALMAVLENYDTADRERLERAQQIARLAEKVRQCICEPLPTEVTALSSDGARMESSDSGTPHGVWGVAATLTTLQVERDALRRVVREYQQQRTQAANALYALRRHAEANTAFCDTVRKERQGFVELTNELESYAWRCEERLSLLQELTGLVMQQAERRRALYEHRVVRGAGGGGVADDEDIDDDDDDADDSEDGGDGESGGGGAEAGSVQDDDGSQPSVLGDDDADGMRRPAARPSPSHGPLMRSRGQGGGRAAKAVTRSSGESGARPASRRWVRLSDIQRLRQEVAAVEEERRSVLAQIREEEAKRQLYDLEAEDFRRRIQTSHSVPEREALTYGLLRDDVRQLQTIEKDLEERENQFERLYAARCVVETWMRPAKGDANVLLQRVMHLQEGRQRMDEAMALLKSTTIKFEVDLKRMNQSAHLTEAERESAFKEGHNEVKVGILPCLPREKIKQFQRGHGGALVWPLTLSMLEEHFQAHKIEAVYSALQSMVLAYDGMSPGCRARLTTAADVVANAHIIYTIAQYVVSKRTQKWALKYLRLMERIPPARVPSASRRQSMAMY